jgi:hypothetical protein
MDDQYGTQPQPQAFQNRGEAFGQGTSPGLAQNAQSYDSRVPREFAPTSVLHQVFRSPNGLSAGDAPRMTYEGGMMPTSNGMAADTYERARPFLSPSISY